MANLIGNLTSAELIQVAGRLIEQIGVKLEEGAIADKIELSEAFEIFQSAAQDLLKEYAD